MATNINSLSPLKLKELKSSENITIRYARSQQESDNGSSRIISEQFPKAIAIAFSSTWATMFPPVSRMALKDMSRPKRTSVTIIGGSVEIVQMVLTWILSCCEGKGMQKFPTYNTKPFTKYFIIRETADNMGIAVLSKEMESRLNDIASKQIHSEDVRAMYLRMPADHPILKDIAAHIANLIWHKQLKAIGAYRTLREEVPQFDKDVNEVLKPKIAEREEEKLRQKEVGQALRDAKAEKKENKSVVKRTPPRRTSVDAVAKQYHHAERKQSSPASGPATADSVIITNTTTPSKNTLQHIQDETATQHKTLRCSVARKAKGNRPAYVSLSLADAGINKGDFTGDSFLPANTRSRSKQWPRKDVAQQGGKMKDRKAGTKNDGQNGDEPRTETVAGENPSVPVNDVVSNAGIVSDQENTTKFESVSVDDIDATTAPPSGNSNARTSSSSSTTTTSASFPSPPITTSSASLYAGAAGRRVVWPLSPRSTSPMSASSTSSSAPVRVRMPPSTPLSWSKVVVDEAKHRQVPSGVQIPPRLSLRK